MVNTQSMNSRAGEIRLLTLPKKKAGSDWSTLFIEHLSSIANLTILEGTADWSEKKVIETCREYDVLITDWSSHRLPEALADDPGKLRYVCNITGSIRAVVPRRFVEAGIAVTNWGDLPSHEVAEGALTLLLSVLKELVRRREAIQAGEWGLKDAEWSGSVRNLRLGVYGLGVIGRAFLEMVRPLQPRLHAYDPYLKEWPEGVERADNLDELFKRIDAVVITAALTNETRGSITAGHLAGLPDGGVVVNVARGAIIDQSALFEELRKGRLRAGLDVLDSEGKDWIEPGDAARGWPNLLLSAHKIAGGKWNQVLCGKERLSRRQEICVDNITRFVEGRPLRHSFDLIRYDRST